MHRTFDVSMNRTFQKKPSTSYRRRRRRRSIAEQQKSFTSISADRVRNSSKKFCFCRHFFVDIRRTCHRIRRRCSQNDVVASKLGESRGRFLFVDNVDVERPVLTDDDTVQDVDSVGGRRCSDSSSRNDVSEFRFDFAGIRSHVVFFVGELASVIWKRNKENKYLKTIMEKGDNTRQARQEQKKETKDV
jgi:hypothetical protein